MEANDLSAYGVDYEKGLKNCMGNLTFYKKILSMFLDDDCIARAKVAFQDNNQKDLFSCMHEMKGVSGNTALKALYTACIPIVEALRAGTVDTEEVGKLFQAVEEAHALACVGIASFLKND